MTPRRMWYSAHASEPPENTDVIGGWMVQGKFTTSVTWRDSAGQWRIPTNGERTPPPVHPPRWWHPLPPPPKLYEAEP